MNFKRINTDLHWTIRKPGLKFRKTAILAVVVLLSLPLIQAQFGDRKTGILFIVLFFAIVAYTATRKNNNGNDNGTDSGCSTAGCSGCSTHHSSGCSGDSGCSGCGN